MAAKPATNPQAGYQVVKKAAEDKWFAKYGHRTLPSLLVLAVRAYRRDSMGVPGVNDINMYDDAMFVLDTKAGTCRGFNANVDPTRYGWNKNAGKFMARLKPGCYTFRSLYHKRNSPTGHPAFGQSGDVTVERINDRGVIEMTETGQFGIHDHMGGNAGTSSEGCLTHPRDDWDAYYKYLIDKLRAHDLLDGYSLVLIDGPIV